MAERNALISFKQETSDDIVIIDVLPLNKDESSLADIQRKLDENAKKLGIIDEKIDRLTNKADSMDYAVAISSGIISGLIDSFFVGEFSLSEARKWGDETIKKKINGIAKKNDILKSVDKLEKKTKHYVGDEAQNFFGDGRSHHFYDFTHHKSLLGLISSIIAQFTGTVYGIDPATGLIKSIHLKNAQSNLSSQNMVGKIFSAITNWNLHLLSDMAGSTDAIAKGNYGAGIPGPIMSTLSEFASLDIFKGKDGVNHFSQRIFELYKTENDGGFGLDYRMEKGLAHEAVKQCVPVIINECLVRTYYFIRKLIDIIKEENVKNVKDLTTNMFKKALSFNNRTITRMMTISTATMSAIDLADAGIRSGGNIGKFAIRVNYAGIARSSVAVVVDGISEIKKRLSIKEKSELITERNSLLNTKVYILNNNTWKELENTEKSMLEIERIIDNTMKILPQIHDEMRNDLDDVGNSLDDMKGQNQETLNKMKDILD